jgi:hypothetical protein
MSERNELTEMQQSRQRTSKEAAKAQKLLKVVAGSEEYRVEGNKILFTYKKNNGNVYSKFIGFKSATDKKRTDGKIVHTDTYLDLKKKGLLK